MHKSSLKVTSVLRQLLLAKFMNNEYIYSTYKLVRRLFIYNLGTYKLLFFTVTLHDIVHTEKSLTLVFEYLERDLKQYMDDCGGILAMNNVKVMNKNI